MNSKQLESRSPFLLRARNITKRFSDVIANNGINLELRKRSLHALIGENGAGKTTFMKILMGLYKPDEGQILIEEEPLRTFTPRDAINKGLLMVHQHCSLIDTLNSVENLLLTRDFSRDFFPRRREAGESLAQMQRKLKYEVDIKSKTDLLPYEDRKKVEILRALCNKIRLLILDEPTSLLTPQESHWLYITLGELVSETGITILYSTHKLYEAVDYADVITVLRNGRIVFSKSAKSIAGNELVRAVFGEEILPSPPKPQIQLSDTVLSVKNLSCKNDQGKIALQGIELVVKKGEIVGIAGASLSGKLEFPEVLFGLRKAIDGSIEIEKMDVTNASTYDIIRLGVSYIPSGAHLKSIVPDFTVAQNFILSEYSNEPFSRNKLLNIDVVNDYAESCVKEFDVMTPSIHSPTKLLSGGNIQKLILSREFSRSNLKLLMMVNPTSGLDVKTKMRTWQKVLELKKKRVGIIIISEDLDEIKQLSDRVFVLFDGKVAGSFPASMITIDEIGHMILTGEKLR